MFSNELIFNKLNITKDIKLYSNCTVPDMMEVITALITEDLYSEIDIQWFIKNYIKESLV